MTDNKTMYFFIHLPKTGGSSVRRWLNRHFLDAHYSSTSLIESSLLTPEQVDIIVGGHRRKIKCYSDHRLSLYSVRYVDNAQPFTIIRNPVDRFLSRYFFFRNRAAVRSSAQTQTLEQFIHTELIRRDIGLVNTSQLFQLSHGRGLSWLIDAVGNTKCQVFTEPDQVRQWFGTSDPMEHFNASKWEEVPEQLRQRIGLLMQDDMFMFNYFVKNPTFTPAPTHPELPLV
jgi:Sulfotransferase family